MSAFAFVFLGPMLCGKCGTVMRQDRENAMFREHMDASAIVECYDSRCEVYGVKYRVQAQQIPLERVE